LLRSAAIAVTIGFAQMVVLSIGDMNLSVGAIGGATGMFAGWLMQVLGVPPALAVLLALALGTSLGFGNAALVVWTHLNSFIVTLATASLITGGMLILTRARPFSNLPDSFLGIAQIELGGVPVAPLVLIMLGVALVLGLVYRSTSLGREMLAIGANRQAARMSGLAVGRIVLVAHGLSGLLAALAGAIWRRMSGVALGLLIVDLAGALLLTVVTPSFTSTYNLFITGRDFSILLLVALAQMIVLAVGQMNLSIGAIGGLVAIVESGL